MRDAAALVGRAPETIRRWVWSGRLAARKKGNRLIVRRDDLVRAAGRMDAEGPPGLAAWAERAQRWRDSRDPVAGADESAVDILLAERSRRAAPPSLS